jgi:hypothetical protein
MIRGRTAAAEDVRRKRQQLLSFLLRHRRIFIGGDRWTRAHRRQTIGGRVGYWWRRPGATTIRLVSARP